MPRPVVRYVLCLLGVVIGVLAGRGSVCGADDVPVTVPAGFEATRFADDDLAHDIHSLTFDAAGRLVVSGPGYVKTLLDTNGDGVADEAVTFVDGPKSGAQGLYFHGSDLLCVGDGGLLRFRDQNKDGRADGPPDTFLKLKTGSEHNAHAIRKGPDGWWYLIAGNTTEITSSYITLPSSPVKHPEMGVLLRLSPDLQKGEVYAHGFRNAYDFDFNVQGEPFTFDSDDERDVSLPWYRPCRVFHLLPDAHTGWIAQAWKRPDTFFDMPPVLAAFGRGSPTGVVCYRHRQFPAAYRGALFVLDWTFGRVMALTLSKNGEVWQAAPSEFMTARGDYGFAPTDAEVGPDGSLYVSVGGRGTRGSVYRIRAIKSDPEPAPEHTADSVQGILDAPQPLASWSRAQWEGPARKLGAAAFAAAVLDKELTHAQRQRAVEISLDLFQGLSAETVAAATKAPAEVRAAVVHSLAMSAPAGLSTQLLTVFLEDADARVRRHAWEAFALHPEWATDSLPAEVWVHGLADPGAFVRTAAVRALAGIDEARFNAVGADVRRGNWRAALSYGWAHRLRTRQVKPTLDPYAVEIGRTILQGEHPLELKRDAARLVELGLGDLSTGGHLPNAFHGFASPLDLSKHERELDPLRIAVATLYPTGDAALDAELGRLSAVLTILNTELLARLLAQITPDSHPVDDIHQLLIAARLPVTRNTPQQQFLAHAVVDLERKITTRKLNRDTNWPDRINELYEQLVEVDPEWPAFLVVDPDFGQPGHVNFLSRMPPELLPDVAAAFEKQVRAKKDYPWNNDVVFLFGASMSPEHRRLVRSQFENYAVRSAVIVALSDRPEEEDRPKFRAGLESSQLEVLTASVKGLEALPVNKQPADLAALVRTLRRLGSDPAEYPARHRVEELLRRATGQKFGYVNGNDGNRPQPEAIKGWTDWLVANHPQAAAEVLGDNGSELADLQALLAKVSWPAGDVEQGRKLFAARGCVQCHGGLTALGPDLAGSAGRFSREDLFIAIALPNRDVSPRYQTTLVETTQGKVQAGLIIYESVDGVILKNSANQTFRFEADEIVERRRLTTSLMPSGLLKDLQPADLANLYAYLQSLSPRESTPRTTSR